MSNQIAVPISITSDRSEKSVETSALIDSGAGGQFIDQNYARQFPIQKLDEPLAAYNVDGTENKRGKITSFVDLTMTINGRTKDIQLLVTGLGKQKIILGFPWLQQENPEINWATGVLSWRKEKQLWNWIRRLGRKDEKLPKTTMEDEEDEDEK